MNRALAMGSLAGPIMSVQFFGINVFVAWCIHVFAICVITMRERTLIFNL